MAKRVRGGTRGRQYTLLDAKLLGGAAIRRALLPLYYLYTRSTTFYNNNYNNSSTEIGTPDAICISPSSCRNVVDEDTDSGSEKKDPNPRKTGIK